jgi:hypothetical protein
MLGVRLHEDSAPLSNRYLLTLHLEDACALQHDIKLVVLVRLLSVRLWSDEHVDADFEAGGFVDDLVAPAGLAKPFFHGCDFEWVHAANLFHPDHQAQDVVLADRLHRSGPGVVLAGLGREAVDALLCQRQGR